MKRKVLSVMLATAMTATLFAGCGSDASNADSTGTNQHYLQQTESSEYIFRIILCLYRIWYFLLYPDHARFHARNSERYR